jgi:hypothetical protein
LDRARAVAVLEEAKRRDTRLAALTAACAKIPKQLAAVLDPSLLKAFFCTRRAGKSYAIGILLFIACLSFPGCSCLYLGLTKATSIGIMNKDIIRVLNEKYKCGAKWNKSDLTWTFPNGSIIYLRGADANRYEISKVVGQKYKLAVLDEASKYRYNIDEMVYGSLLPAMGDDLGTIVLSGTPSNVTNGLFFKVTTDQEPGWSVHRWSWRDNVHAYENVKKTHDTLLEANPLKATTPGYKQEWCGEWVVDLKALVYQYNEALNTAAELPRPAHEYSYIMGMDLGFKDPTAIVVGAYHPFDPVLYLTHCTKRKEIDITSAAMLVKGLWRAPDRGYNGPYPFGKMVVDAADLQSVEEMRRRHQLPLEAAKKHGKRGVIEVMNADLMTGKIKVLPDADDVIKEWGSLIWDQKKLEQIPKKYEEASNFENHASDASLYLWRAARNYDVAEEPKTPPSADDPSYGERLMWEEVARRAAERANQTRGPQMAVNRGAIGRMGR